MAAGGSAALHSHCMKDDARRGWQRAKGGALGGGRLPGRASTARPAHGQTAEKAGSHQRARCTWLSWRLLPSHPPTHPPAPPRLIARRPGWRPAAAAPDRNQTGPRRRRRLAGPPRDGPWLGSRRFPPRPRRRPSAGTQRRSARSRSRGRPAGPRRRAARGLWRAATGRGRRGVDVKQGWWGSRSRGASRVLAL